MFIREPICSTRGADMRAPPGTGSNPITPGVNVIATTWFLKALDSSRLSLLTTPLLLYRETSTDMTATLITRPHVAELLRADMVMLAVKLKPP
jgi:hypothetical protein